MIFVIIELDEPKQFLSSPRHELMAQGLADQFSEPSVIAEWYPGVLQLSKSTLFQMRRIGKFVFLHKKSPHSASTLINTVSMKFSALFLREMASYKISKFFVNPSFRYLPSIHLISYQIVNTCFQCLR